jgi:hypothetical protein
MIVNADLFSSQWQHDFCSSVQSNIPINSQVSQVGRREILYSHPWHRQQAVLDFCIRTPSRQRMPEAYSQRRIPRSLLRITGGPTTRKDW